MLVFEITDQNRVWLNLNGVRSEFKDEYNKWVETIGLFAKQKSPSRNQGLKATVELFIDELTEFINLTTLPDQDIDSLKEDAKQYVTSLREMLLQLG